SWIMFDAVLHLVEQRCASERAPQLQIRQLHCRTGHAVEHAQRILAGVQMPHPQHAGIAMQPGPGTRPITMARREAAAGFRYREYLRQRVEQARAGEWLRL